MQFSVLALDYPGEEGLAKRLAHRTEHLDGLKKLHASGHFIAGGALVDDSGKMIGSNVFFQFEDRAAFDAWLATEPFFVHKVWESIEVREVRLLNPNA